MSERSIAPRIPSYCRHKATGQAVVTLGGKDFYLVAYNSAESREKYNRLIADWLVNGGKLTPLAEVPEDFTVAELMARFIQNAARNYVRPDGQRSSEVDCYRSAFKPLRELYGTTPAKGFGPRALAALRQKMIEARGTRTFAHPGDPPFCFG